MAWSPDSSAIVFTDASEGQEGRTVLNVLSLETGLVRTLDLGGVHGDMGESSPAILSLIHI